MAKRWEVFVQSTTCHASHCSTGDDTLGEHIQRDVCKAEDRGLNTKVGTWTLSCAPARLSRAPCLIKELDDLATSMAVHVSAVEECVKQKPKSKQATVRKEQTERSRLLAPWRNGLALADERVLVCALRFMSENGFLVPEHGTLTSATMVECHDDF